MSWFDVEQYNENLHKDLFRLFQTTGGWKYPTLYVMFLRLEKLEPLFLKAKWNQKNENIERESERESVRECRTKTKRN